MINLARGGRAVVFFACTGAMLLAGCGGGTGGSGKTRLTRYPNWEYQKYPRIALLPVRAPASLSREPGLSEAAAASAAVLQAELIAAGVFDVQDRGTLRDVLTEQDLSRLADVADPATIIPAGRIQSAQALLIPSITEYDLRASREQHEQRVLLRDPAGRIVRDAYGRPVIARIEIVPRFRHEARLRGAVKVVDTSTGATVFSYSSPPISYDASASGAPPRESPEALALRAAREMALDLAKRLAPQIVRVELDDDMLVVATDYYDGRYEQARKLPPELDEVLLAVVGLPRSCDRNDFRVALVPKDGRSELFAEAFVWSANDPARGRQFRVPLSRLRESGAQQFTAKLYSGRDEAPLLTRDFALEAPRTPAAR